MTIPVLVMPGASLMDITPTAGGVEVRCPGCGNVQVFTASGPARFLHEADCEVHRSITSQTAQQRDNDDGAPRADGNHAQ